MVTEYRDVVIDGTKQHFFKACKTSPMLNKMCGFKKQVHSGWPLTSTTLLKQLVELRNTAVAMYKTSMHRRAGIPDVVQIESPTVGTATSTNLTVLSGGGKVLWVSLSMNDVEYILTALRWQVDNNVQDVSQHLPKLRQGITRATRYGKTQYRVFVNKKGHYDVLYKYFNTVIRAEQCLDALM